MWEFREVVKVVFVPVAPRREKNACCSGFRRMAHSSQRRRRADDEKTHFIHLNRS